ncbi:uncharacterized protein MELLADRAFT_109704 [Melampsora larici-populina 98AG31]|uniref:Secreted protein n=1 Tax=Melampsora larici-populina (strain 98AG31 / pathotype 3-4-7) TaxID=747676 RepID=F4RXC5_MELLP|nr:uncharacterized protein MELLADRAFT_109704 [Melampsora larici-populina 98AG31]EGG02941.1 hypothetical protein MELLADRAFT_109704 [Melampsora larici-populina 98AG31]
MSDALKFIGALLFAITFLINGLTAMPYVHDQDKGHVRNRFLVSKEAGVNKWSDLKDVIDPTTDFKEVDGVLAFEVKVEPAPPPGESAPVPSPSGRRASARRA